jgi:hypothetical protein
MSKEGIDAASNISCLRDDMSAEAMSITSILNMEYVNHALS